MLAQHIAGAPRLHAAPQQFVRPWRVAAKWDEGEGGGDFDGHKQSGWQG
jgi:hypothetical protein